MALWLSLLFGASLPLAAAAASVDGSWCAPDGRQITVSGLAVITPGGQRTSGAYSGRAFSFEVPDKEWGAGWILWLERVADDALRVSRMAKHQQGPPPHGLWRRCPATS